MSEAVPLTKDQLLAVMAQGWRDFDAYLRSISEAQMTGPSDAAGWTAKDHVMHLAVWAEGILAVMDGRSRREGMGIDAALWHRWDVDTINAVIQQRYRRLPLAEVLERLRAAHQRLAAKVQTCAETDLQRSFRSYQPDTTYDGTLAARIIANTSSHYAEHRPWIAAIVTNDLR